MEKALKFRQSQNNKSSTANATLIKFHVHNHTIVIYIQYKFHEIPFIGYLDMAEDGNTEIWKDGQTDNAKPISLPLQWGIIKIR